MLLTEFMQKVTAYNNNGQWTVEIPIAKSNNPGKIFVDECDSEYEAKERAYLWLQEYFNNKRNL